MELWSLPSYVECTIGMLCLFAYFSARTRSRAAIAAMITSEWEAAGAISAIGLEEFSKLVLAFLPVVGSDIPIRTRCSMHQGVQSGWRHLFSCFWVDL